MKASRNANSLQIAPETADAFVKIKGLVLVTRDLVYYYWVLPFVLDLFYVGTFNVHI